MEPFPYYPPPSSYPGYSAGYGGYGGGSLPNTNDPDALQAAITRQQWQHYLTTYAPLEREALARAKQTDFTAEGDASSATVRQSFSGAAGTLSRQFSRLGVNLSAEEREAIKRRTSTALSAAAAGAENVTRRTLKSSRESTLNALIGVGRGVSGTAVSGISAAADAAASREIAYQQARAQYSASKYQALGQAASIGLSFV